jgi:hypothetical protein
MGWIIFILSGDYVSNGTAQESHTEFVYQLNAAIVIRLK